MNQKMLKLGCTMLVGVVTMAGSSLAQDPKIEITPTVSYMFAGSFETVEGYIRLEDGPQYGGILDYAVTPDTWVELSYAYLGSRATFEPYTYTGSSSLTDLDLDVAIHYMQIGAIHQIDKGKVQPFLGIAAGASLLAPSGTVQNYTLEDVWRFALSATGGLKLYLSDRFGLRLQGRLLMPVYFSGGGVWFGTGGASVGASGGIPILQGDLGAGLIISL